MMKIVKSCILEKNANKLRKEKSEFIIKILNEYLDKLDDYAKKDDGQNYKYIQVNTIQQKVDIFRSKLEIEYEKNRNNDITFRSIFE